MLQGFKNFLLRGNIVELAVAFVIGTAFAALVAALGVAFINPLIGLAGGGGVSGGSFTVNGQKFDYAIFINAVIVFVITAAVIYFAVVLPWRTYLEHRGIAQKKSTQELNESEVALLTEIRDLLTQQRSA